MHYSVRTDCMELVFDEFLHSLCLPLNALPLAFQTLLLSLLSLAHFSAVFLLLRCLLPLFMSSGLREALVLISLGAARVDASARGRLSIARSPYTVSVVKGLNAKSAARSSATELNKI